MRRTIANITLLILFGFATRAQARQNVDVTIAVMDAQRGTIGGARVMAYPPGTYSPLTGYTDGSGVYRLQVPPGSAILIQIERDGFRKTSRLVVPKNEPNAHEEFVLEVAGVHSTVAVTASDAPQTVDHIAKALTVIDSAEIEARDEYTLTGVLSSIPGVLVRNSGGPGQASTLRVRGLRSDSAAILIDGMRFRDGSTAQGDAASFLSNLNVIAVDRVEVLRGSGSSLYGTNAASGVVNIVTAQGGGRTHGTIQAEVGNLGFARGRTQVAGGALRDRFKYSAGFVHLNVMRGVDGDDRARSTGLQSFARYDFNSRTSVSGRFMGSDDFVQNNISPTAAGIPAANITGVIVPAIALPQDQVRQILAGKTPIYGTATYIPGRDDPDNRRASHFYTSAVRLQHALLSSISFQANYQRVHTKRIFINGPAGFGFQPAVPNYSQFLGDIDTVDVRGSADLSRLNHFTAGFEFEHERYGEIQDNNLPSPQRVRTETAIGQNARAAYFQDQTNLLQNRLQISLSGRIQTFRFKRPVFNTTGVANNYDRLELKAPPKATTADGSISYFLESAGTKLRAHAGNAYRAPSSFERFGGGFFQNPAGELVFSPYGDPFLSPDRYISVDGGIDQYAWQDHVRFSATYFYTRVATITAFDLGTTIKAGSDPYGRTQGYVNGSGGLSRGVELSADVRPTGHLSLRGSYTYDRAGMDRDITLPGFWRVLGAPRHASTLVVTQQIGKRTTIAADVVHNSEAFGSLSAAGRARAYRYPAFAKVDVSGSFDLRKNDQSTLVWTTRVDNILNRTIYDLGWLAPRATFVTGLSLRF